MRMRMKEMGEMEMEMGGIGRSFYMRVGIFVSMYLSYPKRKKTPPFNKVPFSFPYI